MSSGLSNPVRRVVLRHVASLAIVLTVASGVAVLVADRLATAQVAEHAEVDTRTLASEYVAPLTISDLEDGSPAARGLLDAAFSPRIDLDELRRVKIWVPAGGTNGTIVYSDDPDLVGTTHDLGPSAALFGTGDAIAHRVGEGDYPGTSYPDGTFEAYVGFVDSAGDPYIFEAYLPTPAMAVTRSTLLSQWLPLVIGALLLITLATVPLSVRLARHAARAEVERQALISRALDAGAVERRRLAQQLHDGVVQDLSGAGLALESVGRGLGTSDREVVDQVAGVLRQDVDRLRSLSEELFPAETDRDLDGVVRRLVDEAGLGALDVEVDVAPEHDLDTASLVTVHEVAREALRNVARHARATRVAVAARSHDDGFRLTVADDGVGIGSRAAAPGHLGLRLAEHAARDRDGRLDVASGSEGGTVLTLTLPHR